MAEAPGTLEGWYVLHDFHRIDRQEWRNLDPVARASAAEEARNHLRRLESVEVGASAAYQVVGHKSDLLYLHLRPTVEELAEAERSFADSGLAATSTRAYSFLSVTELSLYEAQARAGDSPLDESELMKQEFVRRRLFPAIPSEMPYISFYPMNKRRGETVNWYAEDMEDRRRMMREHGATGRQFTDRIRQMITGAMGFDDWEWGVTLFSADPIAIKKLVAQMRFDEVSAKYAEFGPFYFGIRLRPDDLPTFFGA